MASLAAIPIGRLRGAPIKYWVMDLNPDQAVALGKLRSTAIAVRLLEWLNRWILRVASDVVVLDRFMAARVNAKHQVTQKLRVIRLGCQDQISPVPHRENLFRTEHGLNGKFVVMYSGNHGPSHPFSTILQAAERLRDHPRLLFMFVGGGTGKRDVEAAALPNVRSLPYQPLAKLRYSLSAADVHLVTMGDDVVGIVHPCKVYGAMAVARPILLLGPQQSHVGELLEVGAIGWTVRHGDVDGAVRVLKSILELPNEELVERGRRARALISARLNKRLLCGRLCDVLEQGLSP